MMLKNLAVIAAIGKTCFSGLLPSQARNVGSRSTRAGWARHSVTMAPTWTQ